MTRATQGRAGLHFASFKNNALLFAPRQPWTVAMEATIFTGWIYDHLRPHASEVKVAHPLMLRAIAAAKKKNDKVDASKIADCLRCDFLPECYMASTEIRDRRRTLRYRHLLVRQMVQMKNRVSGLLMENGSEPQQAATPQGGLFPRFDGEQREYRREYPAASSTEPGNDHATREDRIGPGPFSAARSVADGESPTAQDSSWSWADHRPDVGTGDGRYFAVPVDPAGRQLLRALRG